MLKFNTGNQIIKQLYNLFQKINKFKYPKIIGLNLVPYVFIQKKKNMPNAKQPILKVH